VTGEALDAATRVFYRRTFAGVFAKPLAVEPFLALLGRLLPPDSHPPHP